MSLIINKVRKPLVLGNLGLSIHCLLNQKKDVGGKKKDMDISKINFVKKRKCTVLFKMLGMGKQVKGGC